MRIDLYNILCYTLPVNEFAQFPLLGAWVDWPVCGAIHLCTLSGLYVYVSSIAAPWEAGCCWLFILRGSNTPMPREWRVFAVRQTHWILPESLFPLFLRPNAVRLWGYTFKSAVRTLIKSKNVPKIKYGRNLPNREFMNFFLWRNLNEPAAFRVMGHLFSRHSLKY